VLRPAAAPEMAPKSKPAAADALVDAARAGSLAELRALMTGLTPEQLNRYAACAGDDGAA
jgi:hypothetical protein